MPVQTATAFRHKSEFTSTNKTVSAAYFCRNKVIYQLKLQLSGFFARYICIPTIQLLLSIGERCKNLSRFDKKVLVIL